VSGPTVPGTLLVRRSGKHEADPRAYRYGLEAFEPRRVTFELNNNYALDGRDPNSVGFSGPSADMIGHGPRSAPSRDDPVRELREHRAKDVRDGLCSPVCARYERCAYPAGAVDLN
jgi:hypothetical protein